MHVSFRHIGLAVIALSLGACADYKIDPNVFYGDLSEAEQTKYMATVVAAMNAVDKSAVTTGDTQRDVITTTGTYPKVVSPQQLKKASAAISKINAENPACYRPEITALTRYGIGYQEIMKDLNGTVVYQSELCEGATFAPRPYGEQTEEQQEISLTEIAKRLEATTKSQVLNPNSNSAISYTSDSVKDAIYGKLSFKTKLSTKTTKLFEAEFNQINGDRKVCTGADVKKLNENGIHFEYRIVDHRGKNIVTPWICPAKNSAALTPAPKLRGQTASR